MAPLALLGLLVAVLPYQAEATALQAHKTGARSHSIAAVHEHARLRKAAAAHPGVDASKWLWTVVHAKKKPNRMVALAGMKTRVMKTVVHQKARQVHHRDEPKDEEAPKEEQGELPSQGFEGEGVKHKDGETHTDDWGKEYKHKPKPSAPQEEDMQGGASPQAHHLSAVLFLSFAALLARA